ncbi:MAG TPA: hypothetical protein VD769_08720 [Gaiellaceae bacterium]|nr:hypothetical protein [Gaiellaceae bacterium]
MAYRLSPVTRASLRDAPAVCVDCVFWQGRGRRPVDKGRWAERMEEDWGAWGTLYQAEGDRLLGFVQYGPSAQFPRAADLPAGPPSSDAILVTCAYLVDVSSPWVLQSLFLAAIGEVRDRGIKAIETFGYRYPDGATSYERVLVHRTVFPSDFLADFGFYPVRWQGDVCLARLELGGLVPVEEGMTARAWRRAKEALVPAPVPQRP